MAVSKRTRFEVLRRDDHTCRYCGGKAPEVTLTVDHVLPVALGGTDDPTNLVACCHECNAGKSSTSPGEKLVADVNEEALKWAAAREIALRKRAERIASEKKLAGAFLESWRGWDKDLSQLPHDWEQSILGWLAEGITLEELDDCLCIALGASHIPHRSVFRYMAGVVRNKVAELDQATRAELEAMNG